LQRKAFTFEFEAVPPYCFDLTVHKPAGWWWSTPNEVFQKRVLWTTVRVDSCLYGLRLRAAESSRKRQIVSCTVYSDKKLSGLEKDSLASNVERALGVKEDINEFYLIGRRDKILQHTIDDLWGMRTVAWPELFPALILAVTLQMAPMKRSNQMMDLLIANFGDNVHFGGKTIAHWPSADRIAELGVNELEGKAKLGYRAKSLISIARALRDGFPTADELLRMSPNEAKKQLMTLHGIGDYSAELIMPGMGFPLDVWSAKIFGLLFLGEEPQDPRDAIPELKKMAIERWGKWRGHAFVYVLNDLPMISKGFGVDLTNF